MARTPQYRYEAQMSTDEQRDQRPSVALRLGTACALLGVVIGGILAYRHLDSLRDLLHVASYGHYMLPSLLLGGTAIAIAIVEQVRSGEWMRPICVFGLGLAAMATPLVFGFAIGLVVLAMVVTIVNEAG